MYFVAVFVAAVSTLFSIGANAASFTVDTRNVDGLPRTTPIVFRTIRLTGMIETGDADRLRNLVAPLARQPRVLPDAPLATLELSSMGGDLIEGLRLGYLMREYNLASVVRRGDLCLSACALAFLGGTALRTQGETVPSRTIEIGARVGFHNFFLNPAIKLASADDDPAASRVRGFNEARSGASRLFHYAIDMGIDPGRIAGMVGRPAEIWDWLETADAFLAYRSCPAPLAWPVASLQAQATNICNHATGSQRRLDRDQALPLSNAQARRLLLEQLQRQLAGSKIKGALARDLMSAKVMRDDNSSAALYADLGAAGLPLPELVGSTFRVGPYPAGNAESECIVSISPQSPERYRLALIGPEGLSRPPRSPPAVCPGLFLYDAFDVINPQP